MQAMSLADGDGVACSTLCTTEDAVLIVSTRGRGLLLPASSEHLPMYKAKGSKGVKVGCGCVMGEASCGALPAGAGI